MISRKLYEAIVGCPVDDMKAADSSFVERGFRGKITGRRRDFRVLSTINKWQTAEGCVDHRRICTMTLQVTIRKSLIVRA
jgi:hypothetical protein